MKHLSEDDLAMLRDLTVRIGAEVSEDALMRMAEYLDGIMEKNQGINLTRIRQHESAIRLHLVDSLLALPEVNSAPPGTLLDLGSGGGFPGVPLCLGSGRRGVLLDSVGKKSIAVQDVLVDMGLADEIETLTSRAEELAQASPGKFPVITARAVSSLSSLVELASPLLTHRGQLIALKGRPDQEELERAKAAGSLVGMSEISSRACFVPEGNESRTIIVYEKIGSAKVKLPRRVGLAQKSPFS